MRTSSGELSGSVGLAEPARFNHTVNENKDHSGIRAAGFIHMLGAVKSSPYDATDFSIHYCLGVY